MVENSPPVENDIQQAITLTVHNTVITWALLKHDSIQDDIVHKLISDKIKVVSISSYLTLVGELGDVPDWYKFAHNLKKMHASEQWLAHQTFGYLTFY